MKLEQLARRWGVQTSYENYRKEPVDVPREAVEAVLEIMGADGAGPPDAGARVIGLGETLDVTGITEIITEAGQSLPPTQKSVSKLPLGYHRLLRTSGAEQTLIVSPGRCVAPGPSRWGWALQLYSLRSATSWGMGDLRDLTLFARWSAERGADIVMLNPLHAVIPLEQQQASPYFPSSRCFRNPIYLHVQDVPGADQVEDLQALTTRGRALNAKAPIDRDAVYALKMDALTKIWDLGVDGAFDDWMDARGEALLDYATYASLAEAHQGGPSAWPAGLAERDPDAIANWQRANESRIRFHAWLQWLLEQQLAEAADRVGVVNDVAIGVDPEGADAWLWRDSFARGVTVGAPPDEFNLAGQNWGLPPFDPWKLRAQGYAPFIETIRSAMKHGAGIRIDHVMGLFRLYWIPDGATAAEGTYVRYPHEDLLGIVALESHRSGALVVGEDLGTVEDLVRDEMQRRNMLSYRLLWFEEEPPERFPELALAAVSNHDVPTIAGLWTGQDIQGLKDLGLEVNEEGIEAQLDRLRVWTGLARNAHVQEVIDATYELLSKAPSALVMATLEDTLGVVERPNLPGTMNERPNWSIPLPVTLEELEDDPRILRAAEILGKNR